MEFHNLGKHCHDETCKQKDFLPFTCKFCEKIYCLDHRDPTSHSCQHSKIGDIRVFTCPVCLKVCKFDSGKLTEDDYFSIHQATDCNPAQYEQIKAEKSKKCSVDNCKTKLTTLNTHTCKKCTQILCLNHRFDDQHVCKRPTFKNNVVQKKEEPKKDIRAQGVPAPEQLQPSRNCRNEMLREMCDVCGARFANLDALIHHAEKAHF